MTVNNKIYRTPREITQMWADYFSDLYSPKDHERFDNEHKTLVESKLLTMITSSHTNHRPILDDDINIDAVKPLKRNKSFGSDSISNEHLIHGGNYLCLCLTHLFNLFMSYEHIHADAKDGIIITIPKHYQQQKLNFNRDGLKPYFSTDFDAFYFSHFVTRWRYFRSSIYFQIRRVARLAFVCL